MKKVVRDLETQLNQNWHGDILFFKNKNEKYNTSKS